MSVRIAGALSIAGLVTIIIAAGCGARSPLQPCRVDADCASIDKCATYKCAFDQKMHDLTCQLQTSTNCDDGDPCTKDSCNKSTGACVNEHTTLDVDGDGHYAPLPDGTCGDDCDDTDPRAFPGNTEVCDGVDNDCDGIVDNGASYIPLAASDFQLSKPGFDWAEPDSFRRGAAKGPVSLMVTYDAAQSGQLTPFVQPLDALGKPALDPSILTGTDAAGSGTSLAWTGDRFGVSWSDRRDGNYEIYFALLDPTGKKMAPGDERITVSQGFSVYPSLVWTGLEFVIVWQEEKEAGTGDFKLQGQRLDIDGRLIGDIATLTSGSADEQGPALAAGKTELGLVWVHRTQSLQAITFQPFSFDLTGLASTPQPITLTKPAMSGADPLIAYDKKNDRYVAAYYDTSPTGRTVYGAIVSKSAVVVPATNIAQSPAQSRDPALLALGDRVLFVYADDRDHNSGYELYAHTLSADLSTEIAQPFRVTNAPGDSIAPILAFASNGSVLVLFRDDRGPEPAVFETALQCVMP
jgi:hypothetical protein